MLRTGEIIVIREGNVADSKALLSTVRAYVLTSKFLIVAPEDLEHTVTDEAKWIQSLHDNPNSLLLLALHQGSIVGNIDLTGSEELAVNEMGLINMGILEAYQNKGLGAVLLKAVIDWAKKNHELQVLCLQVVGVNKYAVQLYKNLGFEIISLQRNGFKDDKGNTSDNVIMTLTL